MTAPSDPTALVAELRKRASKEPLLLTDPPQETDLAKLLNGAAATIEAVMKENAALKTAEGAAKAWCLANGHKPDFHWDGRKTWQNVALVDITTEELKAALAEEEDDHRKTEAALTAAEAERDRAREALEPFAKVPRDGAHSGAKYNHSTVFAVDGHELTVGDFRRARAALSTAKERGDG